MLKLQTVELGESDLKLMGVAAALLATFIIGALMGIFTGQYVIVMMLVPVFGMQVIQGLRK